MKSYPVFFVYLIRFCQKWRYLMSRWHYFFLSKSLLQWYYGLNEKVTWITDIKAIAIYWELSCIPWSAEYHHHFYAWTIPWIFRNFTSCTSVTNTWGWNLDLKVHPSLSFFRGDTHMTFTLRWKKWAHPSGVGDKAKMTWDSDIIFSRYHCIVCGLNWTI